MPVDRSRASDRSACRRGSRRSSAAGAYAVKHMYAERFDRGGKQRLRGDHAHLGRAERGEAVDERARHARMQDVADDCDRELAEVVLVVTDGEQVEQSLRRMAVAAVA